MASSTRLANLPVYHSDEHERSKNRKRKRSKAGSKDKRKKDYDTFIPRMSGKEGGGKRESFQRGLVNYCTCGLHENVARRRQGDADRSHSANKSKKGGPEMSRAVWGSILEKWNLERAIAAKARRPRGKRIHSSTLLQKKLRQRRLGCGERLPPSVGQAWVQGVSAAYTGRHTCGAAARRTVACASAPRQSRSRRHAPYLMRRLFHVATQIR